MSVAPPGAPAAGALSPDGNWYWDGVRWAPASSPDGRYRWNGSAWIASAAAGPQWARPYASAAGREIFVLGAFAFLLVTYALMVGADVLALALKGGGPLSSDQKTLVDLAQGMSGLLYFAALVLTIVAFCLWVHRVYRNLPALGAVGLKYSPRWAVGGWFVPILNIWRPYQVMREIWRNTAPAGQGWDLLKIWWGLWLISNYVDNFVFRNSFTGGSPSEGLDALTQVLDAIAAGLAILVVRRLSVWQRERAGERS